MTRGLGLLLCWVASVGACDGASDPAEAATVRPSEPPRVKVQTVVEQSLREVVSPPATLEAKLRAAITPEVGGVLTEIPKDEGDEVKAGEVLVRIAATDVRLALEQAQSGASGAQAGLAQAEANFENAKLQYERYQKLKADDAVPAAELERVEAVYRAASAALDAARSQISAAKTGIRSAKQRVSDTVLRAPFGGFVVARHMDPGEVASPMSKPVLEIVNIDTVYAVGALSELDAPKVAVGRDATVLVDAFPGETFVGKVVMVGQEVDPRTRTVGIRIALDNATHRLKAGMSGKIEIELRRFDALVVPRVALVDRRGREAEVFVLNGNVVERRTVRVDPRFEALLPVEQGLQAGDVVVTWGHSKLREGDEVQVESKDAPAADPPAPSKPPAVAQPQVPPVASTVAKEGRP